MLANVKKIIIESIMIFCTILRLTNSNLFRKILSHTFRFILLEEEIIRIGKKSQIIIRNKNEGFYYLYYKLIEPGIKKNLEKNLKKGGTFIDIGAHIGYYSLIAGEIVGESGIVISFEPHPDNYKKLIENIHLNSYEHIVAEKTAIFEKEVKIPLYLGWDTSTHTLIEANAPPSKKYIKIRTITLDKYCKKNHLEPDIVKIDVEGAEQNVLNSMKQTIKKHHPIIICEIHPNHFNKITNKENNIFEFLPNTYNLFLIQNDGLYKKTKYEMNKICKTKVRNSIGMEIYPIICAK